jgi:para-nitrobenzyl esterase
MATPAAKGLFHRVMTMSGQQIKGASIEIASGRAKTVLAKMGVDGALRGEKLAAQLDALTMEQIQEGTRAVSADWLPVVDGVVLPRNPFDPDAPALSETVPMILGNVHDETAMGGRGGEISWDTAAAALDAAVHEYLGRTRRRRWWRSSARSIPTTRRCRWMGRRRRPSARGRGSAGRRRGERPIR